MSTQQRYAIPVDPGEWMIPSRFDSLLRWEYEDGRATLVNLYEKGKERQWNGTTRIDWSLDFVGVLSYADVDAAGLLARDEQVAADFDVHRHQRA
jgi:hypothetical protein